MITTKPTNAFVPDTRPRGLCRLVLQRRTFVALLLGAVLIVPTALYRERGEAGLPSFRYDRVRRSWWHCADCVLAGDSRVHRGLSPAVMTPGLRARRVVNLAYPNVAFTADYLERVEAVLDPDSPRRMIVIGVTPHGLTADAAKRSEFTTEQGQPTARRCLEPAVWLFDPYGIDVLSRVLAGTSRRGSSYLSPDGWRGATAHVIAPGQEAAKLRDGHAAGHLDPIDQRIVSELVAWVQRWTAAGIRVYGFRPPTNGDTVGAEDELYRFGETGLAAAFEAAGGVWIAVAPDAYESYDGSHLQGTAAVRLSADLARRIAGNENESSPGHAARARLPVVVTSSLRQERPITRE
jgi:hypothetical protein